MLGQRRRLRTNIKPALVQYPVFAGKLQEMLFISKNWDIFDDKY